jgi:hypothetical protein
LNEERQTEEAKDERLRNGRRKYIIKEKENMERNLPQKEKEKQKGRTDVTGCFKNNFTVLFPMLLCGEC